MEDWERLAVRLCELKRLIATMEDEYNGMRKKILEQWVGEGRSSAEVPTSQGVIKLRLDERTTYCYDDEVLLGRLGWERYTRLATISAEKARTAQRLGFIKSSELEGAVTETTVRYVTVRCP